MPAGLFNVVQGNHAVGRALIEHPGIAKVSFTGSVPTGMRVMEAAAGTLKKTTMELGGKSPLIVMPDADLERAADIATMANFFSSGQVCTSGTRVFVHRSIQAPFEAALMARVKAIALGDPAAPETRFGPLVSQAHRDKVMHYIQCGIDEGARLLSGGSAPQDPRYAAGSYLLPTVFTDCADTMRIVREEIFGPVMSILGFDDEHEVLRRANDSTWAWPAASSPVTWPRPTASPTGCRPASAGSTPGARCRRTCRWPGRNARAWARRTASRRCTSTPR